MSATKLTIPEATAAMNVEFITNGIGTQAVHETVVAYRANRRRGTHQVKTKATAAGSGAKPWRQKGTGRARAGYKRSPVWEGGGVVFGPHPRDYSKSTNVKVKRLALKKSLSARIQAGEVFVVDALNVSTGKTKEFIAWLKGLGVEGSVLVVHAADKLEGNTQRATRNICDVETISAVSLNAEILLLCDAVILERASLAKIGERLAKK